MIALLKSEFRKLFTVRSTYFVTFLMLIIAGIASYFIEGKLIPIGQINPFRLSSALFNATQTIAQLSAIVAIMFIAHEYRYNTILYTLTAARSRSKVFVSKAIVIASFAVLLSLLTSVVVLVMTSIGLAGRSVNLPPQQFDVLNVFGRMLFFTVGYSLLTMFVTTLVRSIAAAFAIVFVAWGVIESLFGIWLKTKAQYLPLTVMQNITHGPGASDSISPARAMMIFTLYLVVFWLISQLLFIRRDAS